MSNSSNSSKIVASILFLLAKNLFNFPQKLDFVLERLSSSFFFLFSDEKSKKLVLVSGVLLIFLTASFSSPSRT